MTTVYGIGRGEYSDYHVERLFESREDAERYLKNSPGVSGYVEEFELHPTGTTWETREVLNLSCWLAPDGRSAEKDIEYISGETTLGGFHAQACEVYTAPGTPHRGAYINVKGYDHERVRKVFSETIARVVLELQGVK